MPRYVITRPTEALDNKRVLRWACDAVLIATDHSAIDYEALNRKARLIVDTRNAMGRRGFMGDPIVKA